MVRAEEKSVFPLDGGVNLPKDSVPHGLRERLTFEVARGSFDQAMRAIETTMGASCPSVGGGVGEEACRYLVKSKTA